LLQRPEWNLLREKFEAALNPSRQGLHQDCETGRFIEAHRSRNNCGNGEGSAPERTVEFNRAVIRTPELVQSLYQQGLINKVEASLLGARY